MDHWRTAVSDHPIKRIFCLSGRRKNPKQFPPVPHTSRGSLTSDVYNYFIRSTAGNLLICRTGYQDNSDLQNPFISPEKTYTASCNISGFVVPIPGNGIGVYENIGWYWGYPFWDTTSFPYFGIRPPWGWYSTEVLDIQWKTAYQESFTDTHDQAGIGTMTNLKTYPFKLIRVNPDQRVGDEKWWFCWEFLYFYKEDGLDSPVGTYKLHTSYDGCNCAVGNGSTYYDNKYLKAYEDSTNPADKLKFPPDWLTGTYPNYSVTTTEPIITITEKYA